jgi:hypothetical protein
MSKFDSDNQPEQRRGRGKAFKTKLFEAIRAKALLNVPDDATNEEVEQAFIQHLALEALKADEPDIYLMKDLMARAFPPIKAAMDTFNFELDPDSSPSEKAQAILVAVSRGEIPPDVATMLINASKAALDIEALTEMKDRIDALEKAYEQSSQAS